MLYPSEVPGLPPSPSPSSKTLGEGSGGDSDRRVVVRRRGGDDGRKTRRRAGGGSTTTGGERNSEGGVGVAPAGVTARALAEPNSAVRGLGSAG